MEDYGAWIHIQKKKRRPQVDRRGGQGRSEASAVGRGREESRFSVLNEIKEEPDFVFKANLNNPVESRVREVGREAIRKKGANRETGGAIVHNKTTKADTSKGKEKIQSKKADIIKEGTSKPKQQRGIPSCGGGGLENPDELSPAKTGQEEAAEGRRLARVGMGRIGDNLMRNPFISTQFNLEDLGKPLDVGHRLGDSSQLEYHKNGKRVLRQTVEDTVSKSVKLRYEGEASTSIMEEEEVASLVESTFQEERLGN